MSDTANPWDLLIVTASNDQQAEAYRSQLMLRRDLGLLAGVDEVTVVADPDGVRIGSGGSTLLCLMTVLSDRLSGTDLTDPNAWRELLAELRILIVHAGGDSRRLPAYGPCGKIFVPVPGESDAAVPVTLFDKQLPTYLHLSAGQPGAGQVVIVSGDVLLSFDPTQIRLDAEGIVGLATPASPTSASKHGVYCPGPEGRVRGFLQKPSVDEQRSQNAVDRLGQSLLDIGVISFDAASAVAMLELCEPTKTEDGLCWSGPVGEGIEQAGLDFYREICCALGTDASADHHRKSARQSGSGLSDELLGRLFEGLHSVPFHVRALPHCGFLHFGTSAQMVPSGQELLRIEQGVSQVSEPLTMNTAVEPGGSLTGVDAWVEGCRVSAPVTFAGRNMLVGADVAEPLSLGEGACLDVLPGTDDEGNEAWYVRCYGVDDPIKSPLNDGATLGNMPLGDWMQAAGVSAEDLWDADVPAGDRSVWTARLFPRTDRPDAWRDWLWMFEPTSASRKQRKAYLASERFSLAEMATLADQDGFHARRAGLRAGQLRRSLRRIFRPSGNLSAAELTWLLGQDTAPAGWLADLLAEARWHAEAREIRPNTSPFLLSRILHTLASALTQLAGADASATLGGLLDGVDAAIGEELRLWLNEIDLPTAADTPVTEFARRARAVAFAHLGKTIVASGATMPEPPCSAIRRDEIIWGRAPARLDLGGGWSDTPPYTLEHGGCVINAAVDLNGQPPIHCYARLIDEPVIRIGSIDLGRRIEIADMDALMDYGSPDSEFALAKAAMALSGFSPVSANWPDGVTVPKMMEHFGGGVELTTLAVIPKGSGLGTSSIVAAVVLAVIHRLIGQPLTPAELFHGVLKVEQALTTGGGWQDQIGGAVDGVKTIRSNRGLVPDAHIHYVPGDVLDPARNGGATLLYYTGITRLAKNILQQVVGRYLDRDRAAIDTLRRIHALPTEVADALARKDLATFGGCIDTAWRLNKQLDPASSNERIEALLDRVRDDLYGAKLLGAGGGGFLLMVCKSPEHAARVRHELDADPPNELSRFFEFGISHEGLVVTVC